MWEFYLAAAEMAFREQAMMVFQIQLTKRQGVVPMTRDYITARRATAARASKAASGRRCAWPASRLPSFALFRQFATGKPNGQASSARDCPQSG